MTKIAHLADIHIRGSNARIQEYKNSFDILYNKLKTIRPDIILIAGDSWHTKLSNISPEGIELMTSFFHNLSLIAETHVTLGNHDANLTSLTKMDSISPIIDALNIHEKDNSFSKLHLHKKSGNIYIGDYEPNEPINGAWYEYQPIYLNVLSCFDKEGWKNAAPIIDAKNPGAINIVTYHGSISGCKTDQDFVMPSGEEEITRFDGYDFGMFGDIHMVQTLSERIDKNGVLKPNVKYSGSLIQQNHSESPMKGFLVWDIRGKNDWDVEFVEVENLQPFLTIPWLGTVETTINTQTWLKGSRIRVSTSQTISTVDSRRIMHELKEVHGASEATILDNSVTNFSTISINSVNIKKTSLRNDLPALSNLYDQYITTNSEKHALTQEQVVKAKDLIKVYLEKTVIEDPDQARDVIWSIKNLEFDNVFGYGSGNSINFEKLNGIVGLFGKNRIGKSSVIGTLMFGLHNTTDRGSVKPIHVINRNNNAKSCSVTCDLVIDDVEYRVQRTATRAILSKKKLLSGDLEEKTSTTLNVTRCQKDGTELSLFKENGDTRVDTDKILRNLIGTPQDFLLTALSNQGQLNKFIEEGITERKIILNRFLDLDIFEKMHKLASVEVSKLDAKSSKYPSGGWPIIELEDSINKKKALIEETSVEIDQKKTNVDELRLWINGYKTLNSNNRDSIELLNVESLILKISKELQDSKSKFIMFNKNMIELESKIKETTQSLLDIKIDSLHDQEREYELISENLLILSNSHKEQTSVLQGQEKSVRKLSMVPCGDTFPDCHYIKDSHQDRLLIDGQRELVQTLTNQLPSLQAAVLSHQKDNIGATIKQHETMTQNMVMWESDLVNKNLLLNNLNEKISELENSLLEKTQRKEELVNSVAKIDHSEFSRKENQLKSEEIFLISMQKKKELILMELGSDKTKLEACIKDKDECEILLNELTIYESVASAFHKNGIPAMVLKTQLPSINLELSKILVNAADFKVSLDTDINSNVMDIWIEDSKSRRIIETASGAEKMIASLALRVALINLSSLPKPNFLILDEICGPLDEENMTKVLEFITSLKQYFKTIIIISHVPAVKEIVDIAIEIQNNGIESKIEYN